MSGARAGFAIVALLAVIGCHEAAGPLDAGVAVARRSDAAVAPRASAGVALARRLNEKLENVPLASGEVLWGVALPIGCVPDVARPDWVGLRCYIAAGAIERFYRFRFPAFDVQREGDGRAIRPRDPGTGYARIQIVHLGTTRARLSVYRRGAPADDPVALGLLQRLTPPLAADPRPRRPE